MSVPKVGSVTLTNKGQVTLSSKDRKQLGLTTGATLTEVVVGNCVILMPQNQALEKIRKSAQHELEQAGVTVDQLKAEVEKIKQERLAKRYPNLANAP